MVGSLFYALMVWPLRKVRVSEELSVARLQDQVGQSEIIPPANCNEKIFGGVD